MVAAERFTRILVVEDDDGVRRFLLRILAEARYKVLFATDGGDALVRARDCRPDLVILDLSLPGLKGLDVCQKLRSLLPAPIIVLSDNANGGDTIAAFDRGADQYLVKPFSAEEILVRVRALLNRHSSSSAGSRVTSIGNLEIDARRRRVSRAGREIDLTRTEFDLLLYLAQNVDSVLASKTILKKLWGPGYVDKQTLRVHISNLRQKIEPNPSVPRYILTIPGVGYRFAPQEIK